MSLESEIREANAFASEHDKAYRQEARERLAAANNVYQVLSLQVEEAMEQLEALGFIQPTVSRAWMARLIVETVQDYESATAKEARDLA